MQNKKRIIIWSVVGLLVVLFLFFLFGGYTWFANKQTRVLAGTAKPYFPYSDYSLVELEQMYNQNPYDDVATVRGPEETHQLFLSHLKAGEIDEAVECCFRKGDWGRMKDGIGKIKSENKLGEMITDLDKDLIEDLVLSNQATYTYGTEKNGIVYGSEISFVKDLDGMWMIESL